MTPQLKFPSKTIVTVASQIPFLARQIRLLQWLVPFRISLVFSLIVGCFCVPQRSCFCFSENPYAELQFVDSETQHPVPLVEIETVNGLRFVTDNVGRIAFYEPGLMGTEIFFFVRSHGYEIPQDGFGFFGLKATPASGGKLRFQIQRKNIAARLGRLTGEGRYRDSILLGYSEWSEFERAQGMVAGQDSVQATVHQDRVFWLWGDTQRMSYPLGLFRTAGATTSFSKINDLQNLSNGHLPYEYFVDGKSGFVRPVMPYHEKPDGVIWLFALFVVPDDAGQSKMVAHYSRRAGLQQELEHGIAVFDDSKNEFVVAKQFPLTESWRRPTGHPIEIAEDGKRWIYFGSPTPNVRVPANLRDVLDCSKYQSLICDIQNKPTWRWQAESPPTTSEQEQKWVEQQTLAPADTRFSPQDANSKDAKFDPIRLHRGSVHWNAYRSKWILIAGQIHGENSMLGEIWYAEADHPTGPFPNAVKIVTHDRQSFYNVCHHPFLDTDNGRIIHFEGTYTNDFSGNPDKTPRYNYNQIMYELDLSDPRLECVHK